MAPEGGRASDIHKHSVDKMLTATSARPDGPATLRVVLSSNGHVPITWGQLRLAHASEHAEHIIGQTMTIRIAESEAESRVQLRRAHIEQVHNGTNKTQNSYPTDVATMS